MRIGNVFIEEANIYFHPGSIEATQPDGTKTYKNLLLTYKLNDIGYAYVMMIVRARMLITSFAR